MKVWEWDENSEVMLFGGQSVGGTGKNMLNFKAKAASVMFPFLEWGPAFLIQKFKLINILRYFFFFVCFFYERKVPSDG